VAADLVSSTTKFSPLTDICASVRKSAGAHLKRGSLMRCDAANSSGGFTPKTVPPDIVLLPETVSAAGLGPLFFGMREIFINM
jgi:hypothetical protein